MTNTHVTSLELSKKLYEAGIIIKTLFEWVNNDGIEEAKYFAEDGDYSLLMTGEHLISYFNDEAIHYPAPLSSELGQLLPVYAQFEEESLPFQIKIEKGIRDVDTDEWEVLYWRYGKTLVSEPEYQERGRVFADTEANARAKMLLYLKEKGLL